MTNFRYEDDPIEKDVRVLDWAKDLRRQPWTRDLSKQELLNEARIRVHYQVVPRPVEKRKKKKKDFLSDSEVDLEILKIKIKMLKLLKLKIAKATKKANKQVEAPKPIEINEPILDFRRFKQPTKKIVFEEESEPSDLSSDNQQFEEEEESSEQSLTSEEDNVRYLDINLYFPNRPVYSIRCLSDSGCSLMLAKKNMFPPEAWKKQSNRKIISFANQEKTYIEYKAYSVKFKVGQRFYTFDFWQYDQMSHDIIIGNPFWIQLQKTERGGSITQKEISNEVSSEWRREIEEILQDTFSDNPLALYSEDQPQCTIELLPPEKLKEKKLNVPIRCKPITANPIDTIEFKQQIKELIDLKLIRPSNSPWSFPAFMVRNHSEIKRGKARMVTEESIPYTAFSTPIGSYEWLVMPFGLATAPSIFQNKMDNVLKQHQDYSAVYIDDVIVFSNTEEEHIKHLKLVANSLQSEGIVISKKKMELGKSKIEFLDDVNHVKAIKAICMKLPALELPRGNDELIVNTDASDGFWSGVLSFKIPPSKEIKISRYCTGSWNPTESNWSIFDKELRAVKLALQKFKMFLFNDFTLFVDNLALVSFITKEPKDSHTSKQIRDKLFINQFSGFMTYRR
ncbi:hypothetical protein L6452_20708 [Arctium lappa]|uniref:Uncharacterized protein n=1 Tax=Arctium lappa TaxID=4217 RepID=A0ACB9BCJ7_ARCLA|nr:hypothetical protein L6452_20708 [Arctium lappa]